MKKIAMGAKIVRISQIAPIWLSLLANLTSKTNRKGKKIKNIHRCSYSIIIFHQNFKASLSSRTTRVKTIYSNHTY